MHKLIGLTFWETFWFIVFIWDFSECTKSDASLSCKFPNEGCQKNDECCSGKCIDAHPGTNSRCTKLSLHRPCLYTYQCEDRLKCGKSNKCCAKYWGICSHPRDCCDPAHKCVEAEGFYYKRCLYSDNVSRSCNICRPSVAFLLLLCAASFFMTRGR